MKPSPLRALRASLSVGSLGLALGSGCLLLAFLALALVLGELRAAHDASRALLGLQAADQHVTEVALGLADAETAAAEAARGSAPEARAQFDAAARSALLAAGALVTGPAPAPGLPIQVAARLETLRTAPAPETGGTTVRAVLAEIRATLAAQRAQLLWREGAWRRGVFIGALALIVLGVFALVALAAWAWAAVRRQRETRGLVLRAQEAVARSEQAKGRFLQAIGHDLGQPLQAIELFVTGLQRLPLQVEAQDLLGGIRGAVGSLRRMLRGLTEISRLDAGAIAADRSVFPLDAVLEPIAAEFSALAAAQGLRFLVERTDILVESDPVLLESILRNLVSNAIRYTPRGSVTLSCRIASGEAVIAVADTGPGIPEEELDRIFHDFYRAPGTMRTTEGLGLGLGIVRRMAGLLGVTVRVRSKPGAGAIFDVLVPLGARPAEAAMPAPQAVPLLAPSRLAGLRLLLVDDDAAVREGLAREMGSCGMLVTATASAAETCALFEREPQPRFDAALVDHDLRGPMTGTELLDCLASHYAVALPALVISGSIDPQAIQEMENSGYPWLSKPIAPERLAEALRGLLARGAAVEPEGAGGVGPSPGLVNPAA